MNITRYYRTHQLWRFRVHVMGHWGLPSQTIIPEFTFSIQ